MLKEVASNSRLRTDIRKNVLLSAILLEVANAEAKHPDFCSAHHGHSVIREEMEELWDLVKVDQGHTEDAGHEAIQIAASAFRYALNITSLGGSHAVKEREIAENHQQQYQGTACGQNACEDGTEGGQESSGQAIHCDRGSGIETTAWKKGRERVPQSSLDLAALKNYDSTQKQQVKALLDHQVFLKGTPFQLYLQLVSRNVQPEMAEQVITRGEQVFILFAPPSVIDPAGIGSRTVFNIEYTNNAQAVSSAL